MNKDLEFLAKNLHELASDVRYVGLDYDGEIRFYGTRGTQRDFYPVNKDEAMDAFIATYGSQRAVGDGYTQEEFYQAKETLKNDNITY